MIKIGVSSCFMYPDENRVIFGPKTLCYLERDMARYLFRKDVLPILIPDLEDDDLNTLLEQMDGFVFQGGTDLAPETYGETPIGRWKGDPRRDQYEMKLLDYAIQNNKPVFGICRGFQLMNAYFGGTLYQDITTQHEEALQHRDAAAYDQLNHQIEFVPDKLLDHLFKNQQGSMTVNTVHHQAVKELGKDLEVLAVCPDDGIIEAFHWTKAPEGKVLGVQWHPEFSANSQTKLIDEKVIYNNFLSYCK